MGLLTMEGVQMIKVPLSPLTLYGEIGILVTLSLFFFQAEDGIRDVAVTGVQTCALPICIVRPQLNYDINERAGAQARRGHSNNLAATHLDIDRGRGIGIGILESVEFDRQDRKSVV